MDMLGDLLKAMMDFFVNLVGVSATEMVKGSGSLQTDGLDIVVGNFFSRRMRKIYYF